MAFGLPAAILSARANVADGFRRQSRTTTASTAPRRLRAALVIAEVSLSVVLLTGAALMARSLIKLHATDLGIDTNGLMTLHLGLPSPAYSNMQTRELFLTNLLDRLRSDPGISAASAGPLPPNESLIAIGPLEFGDRPGEQTKRSLLRVYDVWPQFFATTGIGIFEGREFNIDERDDSAIVSRDFALKHWPGRSAIGMTFRVGGSPWRTIVGIAAEVSAMGEASEVTDLERQEIYYPHGPVTGAYRSVRPSSRIAEYETVIVREREPGHVMNSLAGMVHDLDPRVVVSGTRLVADAFTDEIARPRVVFLMLAVFAGFGLAVAAGGLYGVLTYLVSQRLREIGIRLALGATRREIGRLVFRSGLRLAVIGMLLGLGVSAWLVRAMQTVLYEVEARDPVSIAFVSAILLSAAAFAAWRPARRAMRVDPVTLLREE
jgi:predicted permease